ncbi:MAG: hypothetical protein C4575_10370 [Desulforudis sp.]|jgi:hypothetical protein|nr:MAG: hypothetical protein C4575_10370 [Desulforudis sp.]
MIYMSIVGHQIMAILNPLLSLPRQGKRTLVLFVTHDGKTTQHVETIRNKTEGQTDIELKIIPISSSLSPDSEKNPPAHIAVDNFVRQVQGEQEIFFNLGGGMNFQIAACVGRLAQYSNVKYLYPDFYGTKVYDTSGGNLSSRNLDIPKMDDIFSLQKVKTKRIKTAGLDQTVSRILKVCSAALPRDAELNVEVEGIVFDFIINRANSFSFCKLIRPKTSLADIREIIGKSVNRTEFAELFHRRILILTSSRIVAERFVTESQGKIAAAQYHGYSENMGMDQEYQNIVRKFVANSQSTGLSRPSSEVAISQSGNAKKGANKILYVFLGREVLPTLKAIWSHRAAKTWLFYTPGDRRVEFCKDRLLKAARNSILPTGELTCVPVGFHAEELEKIDLPQRDCIEVNVTPGTKAHTFFLTRLALRGGGKIMSINNQSGQIEAIDGSVRLGVKVPTLKQFLHLSVESRHTASKKSMSGTYAKNYSMEYLLEFFSKISEEGKHIGEFYKESMCLHEIKMTRQPNKFTLTFTPGGKSGETPAQTVQNYNTSPNDWFEELVSYVLLQSDAEEIMQGVRPLWLTPNCDGPRRHRSELDVLCRFGQVLYCISCKSGKTEPMGASAIEIQNVSAAFGRFAVPLLAFLKHPGDPKKIGKTWVFGYKTFTSFDAMKRLLERAREDLATTY